MIRNVQNSKSYTSWNNQAYLVNYEEREQQNKTYTSQVAESHRIYNQRPIQKLKENAMDSGRSPVLQIRGMITSNEWDDDWQNLSLSALVNVA